MKRYTLVKIHMILAAIALPITVMFFLTGTLDILDIEPEVKEIKYNNWYEPPLKEDLGLLQKIAEDELAENEIEKPNAEPEIRWNKKSQSNEFNWEGRNSQIILRSATEDEHVGIIYIRKPGIYDHFMVLHTGDGKEIFNYFIIASSIMMLVILISGVAIGISLPKFRKTVLYSMGTGLVLMFGLMFYSQFL